MFIFAFLSYCRKQRYVDDPFLLDGKKFSIGVYTVRAAFKEK